MAAPDISVINRTGLGFLSTTFSDPTDYAIIFRKWIFGDGVVVEGPGLSIINHTYYYPGTYTVVLIAQTETEQITVTKENYVIVDDYRPIPELIIAQSFDVVSGEYWRFYFDQYFYLVFEDETTIIRSRDKVGDPNKWLFVDFHRMTGKMNMGSFSHYLKELDVISYENTSPMTFSRSKTEVVLNSSMKIDELMVWSVEKDTKSFYTENRGQAGYLESI
jgi:hypothetical protein